MTTVKCNSCNIVINELLSYVQNKISIVDEETLVRVCTTSFSGDEIKNSKSLLFESIPTNKIKIKRKNKGKEERDLYDILNLFKSTEPDVIPVFVARELEKLPPILFDHLDCTKLLKDLLKVQNDLDVIKSNYVTQDQLSECKSELLQMKNDSLPPYNNVNLKRGAWTYDSGPMGLSHINNSALNESFDSIGNKSSSWRNMREFKDATRVDQNIQREPSSNCQRSPSITERGEKVTSPRLPAVSTVAERRTDKSGIATETHSSERHSVLNTVCQSEPLAEVIENEGWKAVQKRKKPHYRYHGLSGVSKDTEGNFKAADKKVPVFITRVHKDTIDKDIQDYVYRRTKETIKLEKITFKHERDHKAFKFFVSENKLSIFLDDKLWPQGILFRRFVNFRQKNTNGNKGCIGLTTKL